MTRNEKKPENKTHNQEQKQPIETDFEIAETTELLEEEISRDIITIFHCSGGRRKYKQGVIRIRRLKKKLKHLKQKYTGQNQSVLEEEKVSKHEGILIETN